MGPWAYATHLMSTPRLPFTATYFGSIALTLYFSLGVSIPNIFCRQLANLNWHAAPKPSSDADIQYCTIGMLALVLGQLFPDGFQWSSIGDLLWCTTGCGMDDRVEMDAGRITVLMLFWSAHYIFCTSIPSISDTFDVTPTLSCDYKSFNLKEPNARQPLR